MVHFFFIYLSLDSINLKNKFKMKKLLIVALVFSASLLGYASTNDVDVGNDIITMCEDNHQIASVNVLTVKVDHVYQEFIVKANDFDYHDEIYIESEKTTFKADDYCEDFIENDRILKSRFEPEPKIVIQDQRRKPQRSLHTSGGLPYMCISN